MKKTKQGLRDLNSIPAAKMGRKLELPENQFVDCKHIKTKENQWGDVDCLECGADLGNVQQYE